MHVAVIVATLCCCTALLAEPWRSVYRIEPANPYHLVNDDGEHLFILGKTAWAYFGCDRPEVSIERCRQLGANVMRVTLEGAPYHDQLGIDMWPWGGTRQQPDFSTFNEPYWKSVEQRIEAARHAGIGIDLCLYFTLKPGDADIELHRAYWQRCIDRLGKFANVLCWEIHNEYSRNETFQDAAGSFFAENDPRGRPVITSTGTTDGAIWPDKPWMKMAINHSCTGSHEGYPLDTWYLALARNTRSHGKPAWCNETGREKRHKNDDGVHRRKQAWLWSASGAFWTWHSWDGCEGIDDAEYVAPGQEYMKPMADFFRGIEFWKLSPIHTAIETQGLVSATLADASRTQWLSYICTNATQQHVSDGKALLRLPEGQYELTFIDPITRKVTSSSRLSHPGLYKSVQIELPAFTDDCVVFIRRSSADAGPVPGTR